MTRTQAISTLHAKLPSLPDERIELLAEVVQAWSQQSVWSSLTKAEQAEADQALDSLDRGEGIPLEDVESELDALLSIRSS